jgi:hypothetical protein
MDDKTKNILKSISPLYAMTQGSMPGIIGAGVDYYNKKKERNKKLSEENMISGGVPEANKVERTTMSHGGRVRGSGIAKKGVRACKVR